jgi:general secretion pathway protein D
VKSYIDVGSISQPIVGQNKSTADLRLREGEINILAGLTRQQDSETITGIPGLVDIPVLGKILFGKTSVTKDRGDLMIALIPHIVRSPDYSAENLRGISAGVDQQLKLTYAPRPEPLGSVPAAAPAPAATPAIPGLPTATAPPAPGQGARVTFNPGVIAVPSNAPFTVSVQVENATDAASVTPLRVSWDPALLRLNDIAPGALLSRDGGRVTSVKDIRNESGQATLTISRAAGAAGVSGSGAVATLTFVALMPGTGRVTVTEMGLTDTQNRSSAVALSAVPVTVQ